MHAPPPYQPIVPIPEVPVPTVMSPSASASQLHPTQMQPPWGLGKGFWVFPPCPPSHMPASLHAAVFGWITALKSLEVLQPGAPVLAQGGVTIGQRLPSSGPVSSSDTWGQPQDGLHAARMLSGPETSFFALVLRHPGPGPSWPCTSVPLPPARLTEPHRQTHLTRSLPN